MLLVHAQGTREGASFFSFLSLCAHVTARPVQQGARSDQSWYEKIVKPIATVRTVEEFWRCYSHLSRANDLVSPSDYHLFKEGISPLWEDEANQKGGKWMVRLPKGLASEKWEALILALVGDQMDIGEEICGAVASIRYQEDIIAVWNRDAADEEKKGKICEAMRQALDLSETAVLEYKEHNASLRDNSSFRNTNVYRPPGMRGQPGAIGVGIGAVGPGNNSGERSNMQKGGRRPGGQMRNGQGSNTGTNSGKSSNKRGGNKMTVWRPGDTAAQVDESGEYVQPVIPVVHAAPDNLDGTDRPMDLWGK